MYIFLSTFFQNFDMSWTNVYLRCVIFKTNINITDLSSIINFEYVDFHYFFRHKIKHLIHLTGIILFYLLDRSFQDGYWTYPILESCARFFSRRFLDKYTVNDNKSDMNRIMASWRGPIFIYLTVSYIICRKKGFAISLLGLYYFGRN